MISIINEMVGVQRIKAVLAFLVAALMVFALSACTTEQAQNNSGSAENSGSTEQTGTAATSVETTDMDFEYTDRDKDASYDAESATMINLSDSGSTAEGEGVSIEGSTVTITQEGTYIAQGTLSDGSIRVEAADTEKVQLVLDGVIITCKSGPALLVEETDKIFVTLAEGSTNTLSDSENHETGTDDNDHDGAVFSHSDIAFNGSGSLTVKASYANGIVSKDDLVITGGTYNIEAPEDAMQGQDCVKVFDGDFTIVAGEDGIKSNNTEDATRGFVSIDGGTFDIAAENDGVQSETVLHMTAGEIKVETGGGATQIISGDQTGDAVGGNGTGSERPQGGQMMGDQQEPPTGEGVPGESDAGSTGTGTDAVSDTSTSTESTDATTTTEESTSYKGLKAGSGIEISGGTITADTLDDAVHSNGAIEITGGTFDLTTDDDAIHADGSLVIDEGTITVGNSYEGLEGSEIYINGGDINIRAVDDGINAAGDSASAYTIQITGGFIFVDADSDALDSNDTVGVTGGTLVASGAPTGDGNGLDADGTLLVSGGYVVASGTSSMATSFAAESEQASVLYTNNIEAGQTISLADSSGNVIMTFEAPKAYGSLVLSAPELTVGETYSLYLGSTLSSDAQSGFSVGGSIDGAQLLTEFTQSETSISVSSTGEVSSAPQVEGPGGGMGGGGQMGGERGGGGTPPQG